MHHCTTAAANLRLIRSASTSRRRRRACSSCARRTARGTGRADPRLRAGGGKVERACRERIVGGDDALAPLERSPRTRRATPAPAPSARPWPSGAPRVEEGRAARCAARPVLLATAIADELARRGMMRTPRRLARRRARRAADAKARAARPARGACGAVPGCAGGRPRRALEAAIGGDADATGAPAPSSRPSPAAPVRRRGALPHARGARGARTDAAAAADARAALAAALPTLAACRAQMEPPPAGASLLEASCGRHAAQRRVDVHRRRLVPRRRRPVAARRRPLASAVVRAASARVGRVYARAVLRGPRRRDLQPPYHAGRLTSSGSPRRDDVTEGAPPVSAPWLDAPAPSSARRRRRSMIRMLVLCFSSHRSAYATPTNASSRRGGAPECRARCRLRGRRRCRRRRLSAGAGRGAGAGPAPARRGGAGLAPARASAPGPPWAWARASASRPWPWPRPAFWPRRQQPSASRVSPPLLFLLSSFFGGRLREIMITFTVDRRSRSRESPHDVARGAAWPWRSVSFAAVLARVAESSNRPPRPMLLSTRIAHLSAALAAAFFWAAALAAAACA